MAAGDLILHPRSVALTIIDGASADTAAPTLATDGVAIDQLLGELGYAPESYSIELSGTRSGGTAFSVTARLWVYSMASDSWMPPGAGTDTDKGKLNEAVAIGETVASTLLHVEPMDLAMHFERIQIQVTLGGGETGVDYSAYLIAPRGRR